MSDEDRHTRQRRLREVGDRGQALLSAASVLVEGRDAAATEALYLERAGVLEVRCDADAAPRAFVHAELFRNAACRSEAAAAWRALQKTLAVLNQGRA